MPNRPRDIVPRYSNKRRTPRSLARTLRKLREEGSKRTITEMAAALCICEETLQKWEGRREELTHSITVEDLRRYEDVLGIPMGIICLMAQVLAATRDGRADHLEVMAAMMRALLERIDTAQKRRQAIADVQHGKKPEHTTFRDWDNYLVILIGAVWGAAPDELRKTLEKPRRVAIYAARRRDNIARAADRR